MPELSHLHMEPQHPVPVVADGLLLASLPADAIDAIIRVAGPGAAPPRPVVEVRHIGGEMSRARPRSGAQAAYDADYLFGAGLPAATPAAAAAESAVAAVTAAVAPWAADHTYLNIAETRRDPAGFWSPQAYDRLRRIKAAVDPHDLIRSNHPIPPAAPPEAR
jgi:hypothetical protein